jgi:AraC-like DNA-binding protein
MTDSRQQRIREGLEQELLRLSEASDPLDLVEDIPILEAFVDDFADHRIAEARASGASWAEIAQRLGVSRQAVHKRFNAKRKRRRGGAIIELRIDRNKD